MDICAIELRGQDRGTFEQFEGVSNHKAKFLTRSKMRGYGRQFTIKTQTAGTEKFHCFEWISPGSNEDFSVRTPLIQFYIEDLCISDINQAVLTGLCSPSEAQFFCH